MEMHQISLALETYKNKFGEYPPDLSDSAAVVRHVKKRWPRFQLPSGNEHLQYWSIMKAVCNVYQNTNQVTWLNTRYGYTVSTATTFMDNTSNSSDLTTITREASYIGALVFWIGGFPNEDGKFAGFSADPEAPFGKEWNRDGDGNPTTVSQINNGNSTLTWNPNNILLGTQDKDSVFFEMIIGKNIEYVTTANGIVFPALVNRDATANKDGTTPVPYVYFKSNSSSGGIEAYLYPVPSGESGYSGTAPFTYKNKFYGFNSVFATGAWSDWSELKLVSVYAKSGDPFHSSNPIPVIWQEPERFQLIHPGLDGVFGGDTQGTGTVVYVTGQKTFLGYWFRSINTDATGNTIGQQDFDNITNFSDYQQIKSILP
jgi:hypothetical protein